jgi:hypothetical protein
MLRGNAAEIRPADFDVWDGSDYFATAIPAICAESAVDFAELAEVNVLSEVLTHRANVSVELIGRDLVTAIRAGAKKSPARPCSAQRVRATGL